MNKSDLTSKALEVDLKEKIRTEQGKLSLSEQKKVFDL